MPVTFQVVGNLADFGNDPRAGVKVRATATPGVKVGDVAVHSNEPETVVTDETGAFTLELVSLPGVWYTIRTPHSNAMNTVRLAGYTPDAEDPTTGTEFPALTVINLRTVMDEDPTPGYEGLVYSGPPNVLTIGTVTTGAPGSDADADIGGVSPSQTLDLVIPRGDKGDKGDPGEDSTVVGPVGPAPVLSFTATASAPGSAADAEVSGPAETPTVALTLPRGDVGPQGYTRYLVQDGAAYPARPFPTEVPVTFVGSANPDTLGVMVVGDSWINTAADQVIPYVKHYDGAGSPEGVVTAQIGSRYIDVNATAGAVEWTKMSGSGNTGWKVTVGDTGWRNISALIGNGWTGLAWVRRVGNVVDLRVDTLNAAAATVGVYLALPAGFRTNGSVFVRSIFYTTAMTLRRVSTFNDSTVVGYVAGDVLYGSLAASTAEPWPTTLP